VRLAGDVTLDIVEAWAIHLDRLEGPCIVGSRGGVRLSPFGFFRSFGVGVLRIPARRPISFSA
jgi:hypothetical protein